MKIHPLISAHSFSLQVQLANGLTFPHLGGIIPQLSLGCVQSCVGASAASACAHCGGNASCWDSCAGPGKGVCVLSCP
jgi:hypothetical protein